MGWILETNELNKFRKFSMLPELEAVAYYSWVPYSFIQGTGENVYYLVAEGTKEVLSLHFTRGSLSASVN